MLPANEDAKRLARLTCSLGELLAREAPDFAPPPLRRRALVHLHCHQKATSDTACDLRVLERLGLDVEVLDSGCCGLAGSFGYEAGEPYDVSMKAGERVLLPAVRDAGPDTLIVSDGFSCRSQIEHGTERSALHLAQVVQAVLAEGRAGR
jgi:Fe-S oxidoreductase